MHKIFLSKEKNKFSAAHMTVFSDGTKEQLHGHNFGVTVSVEVKSIDFEHFIDFAIIKNRIEELCSRWDHRLLLAEKNAHYKTIRNDGRELEFQLCGKRYIVPHEDAVLLPVDNIIVETLAFQFGNDLLAQLPSQIIAGVKSCEVTITESEGQGGVFYRAIDETSRND